MKQLSMMLGIAAFVMWAGTASAETVRGEILDVSGDTVKIKTSNGEEKSLKLDPAAMQQTSGLTLGDQITAEVDAKGKATSIEKQTGAGSPATPDSGSGSSSPETGSGSSPPPGGSEGGMK